MEYNLQEYKEYYRVRAERYADNPNYKNSYQAEKALNDLMQSANDFESIKTQMLSLSHKCVMALSKDKYIMEEAFFTELQEDVRVKISKNVLEKIDNYDKDVNELIDFVNTTEEKGMREVVEDESCRVFHDVWWQIDDVIIYENAVVPDKYKADLQEWAQQTRESIIDSVENKIEYNKYFNSNWEYNPDLIWEHRHRRLLTYSDENVAEQLTKYKQIIKK